MKKLYKLMIGISILVGLIFLLSTNDPPSGILGATIRYNIEHDIDATPIFYGDVENMSELEAGLDSLKQDNR